MKILVIDDWKIIAGSIGMCFPGATVDHEYRIPTDLPTLDNYDVLIVDNQGIGNAQWKSGEEFLKDYQPKNPNQMVIFHSGLEPNNKFAELLKSKGFFYFIKGNDQTKLITLVKENSK